MFLEETLAAWIYSQRFPEETPTVSDDLNCS